MEGLPLPNVGKPVLPALLVEGGPELQSPRLHGLLKKMAYAFNPRQRQVDPCEF